MYTTLLSCVTCVLLFEQDAALMTLFALRILQVPLPVACMGVVPAMAVATISINMPGVFYCYFAIWCEVHPIEWVGKCVFALLNFHKDISLLNVCACVCLCVC